jgi:hypothetical protein
MITNYWIKRALEVTENEVLLVKASPTTQDWFRKLPNRISVIYPETKLAAPEDFGPRVGVAYGFRLTKFGIEGIIRAAKKFQRYQSYIYFDENNQPKEPFWVIIHK